MSLKWIRCYMQGGCLFVCLLSRANGGFLAPQRENEGGSELPNHLLPCLPRWPNALAVRTLPFSHEGPHMWTGKKSEGWLYQSACLIRLSQTQTLSAPKPLNWATFPRLFSAVWANSIKLHLNSCTDKGSNPPPEDLGCSCCFSH